MKAGSCKSCSCPCERHFLSDAHFSQFIYSTNTCRMPTVCMCWAESPTWRDWRTFRTQMKRRPGSHSALLTEANLTTSNREVLRFPRHQKAHWQPFWSCQGKRSSVKRVELTRNINQPRTMGISCSLGKLDCALTPLCSVIPWAMIRINWDDDKGWAETSKTWNLNIWECLCEFWPL